MAEALIKVDAQFRLGEQSFELSFESASSRLALFGPSGAGKTTALKLISGLIKVKGAQVSFRGADWQSGGTFVPPHLRHAAMVFQDARLFPHMSAGRNIAYAASGDTSEIIDLAEIDYLLDRKPNTLSGGERKSIALARALAARPNLLLLDEPYAGLDRRWARDIRRNLTALLDHTATPSILVSHHLDEVLAHADEVILIEDGKIVGQGTPTEIFNTARGILLLGEADDTLGVAPLTVLAVKQTGSTPQHHTTEWALESGHVLHLPDDPNEVRSGYIQIRATDVSISRERPTGTSILNCLEARIELAAVDDTFVDLDLDLGKGVSLRARITRYSYEQLRLGPGDTVFAMIKAATFAR